MKKVKDYLDDDYGLRKIDLTRIKKLKNNNKYYYIISFLLISFLLYFTYTLKWYGYFIFENKSKIDSINQIKKEPELKITFADTSKTLIQRNEKNDIPITIKKPEIIMIEKKTGKYFIISGSFKDYELSLNEANEFLKIGFQSSIILPIQNKNGYYRVAIDAHLNKNDALSALYDYKNNLNNELWILKH